MNHKILIVDDEPEMLKSFGKLFELQNKYDFTLENDPEKALRLIETENFDLLLSDLMLGSTSGLELTRSALKLSPALQVIIITGYGTIETGVEAIKAGAFDFIEKPFTSKKLFRRVEEALKAEPMQVSDTDGIKNFHGIIYKSREMDELIATVVKIADSEVNVIIQGESGTGKDLVARALQNFSSRHGNPFVPVNCGALPENLFESELFGHEKGSFTGALSTKPGLLEFANKGTFFFDEITERPLQIQSKLLRMIEDKKIRRIGSGKEVSLDIRILSATNQLIESSSLKGKIREDLYFRLSNFEIVIPPLRSRRDDILPIFNHYLEFICKKNAGALKRITDSAADLLYNYEWPGNVREIINLTNRMFFVCQHELIDADDLPLAASTKRDLKFSDLHEMRYKEAKDELLERFEIEYLKYNLAANNGNISKTAESCGMDRRTVHRLIQKFEIVYKN